MSVLGGSLLDRELGGGVGFETLVRDGRTAEHRASIGAGGEAPRGTLDGLQAHLETGADGVVGALRRERLRRVAPVGRVLFGGAVLAWWSQHGLGPSDLAKPGLVDGALRFATEVAGVPEIGNCQYCPDAAPAG